SHRQRVARATVPRLRARGRADVRRGHRGADLRRPRGADRIGGIGGAVVVAGIRAGYQLPRSPSVEMTRRRRTAALRQLRSTDRWAPSAFAEAMRSMIVSCSATDRPISSISELV